MKFAAVNTQQINRASVRFCNCCREHGKARRQLLRPAPTHPPCQAKYLTAARAIYRARVSRYPGPAGHTLRSRSCYGKERPARDDAVKPVETDAVPSAFASVSAHLLEGATDSVLTGSTNAGHSGDDEAAERSAQTRKRIPRPVELLRAHHCHGSAPENL